VGEAWREEIDYDSILIEGAKLCFTLYTPRARVCSRYMCVVHINV